MFRIATNMFPFNAHCLLLNVIIIIYTSTRTHVPLWSLSYTHLFTLRVLKKNFLAFCQTGAKNKKWKTGATTKNNNKLFYFKRDNVWTIIIKRVSRKKNKKKRKETYSRRKRESTNKNKELSKDGRTSEGCMKKWLLAFVDPKL